MPEHDKGLFIYFGHLRPEEVLDLLLNTDSDLWQNSDSLFSEIAALNSLSVADLARIQGDNDDDTKAQLLAYEPLAKTLRMYTYARREIKTMGEIAVDGILANLEQIIEDRSEISLQGLHALIEDQIALLEGTYGKDNETIEDEIGKLSAIITNEFRGGMLTLDDLFDSVNETDPRSRESYISNFNSGNQIAVLQGSASFSEMEEDGRPVIKPYKSCVGILPTRRFVQEMYSLSQAAEGEINTDDDGNLRYSIKFVKSEA